MSVRERVERGAALLDAKEPGWRDRISPAELDIHSCSACVVGQVFGLNEEDQGTADAWIEKIGELGCYNDAGEYGFCGSGPKDYDSLRDEWIRFLKGEEAR